MDYRIEHREQQRFIALVRSFPAEIANDNNDHSIPDFWAACYEKHLIEPMTALQAEGKRNLYGLCSPCRDNETHFRYGIGVMLDEHADPAAVEALLRNGYTLWNTRPVDYAVFKCFGPDGDCLGETWSKFFKEFVPQTGYTQTDDTDYEIYYENAESGLFCELWVPVEKGE